MPIEIEDRIQNLGNSLGAKSKDAVTAYQERKLDKALTLLDAANEISFEIQLQNDAFRAWTLRYKGFGDESIRTESYSEATKICLEVLEKSEFMKKQFVEVRNRVIKLLMLLPGQNVESCFKQGKVELKASILDKADQDTLEAQLLNSLGIPLKMKYPRRAIRIFERAVKLAKYGTPDYSNPLQNESDCWKNLLRDSKNLKDMEEAYLKAKECLEKALQSYPNKEKGHRESVMKKFNQLEEEKEKKEKTLRE